MKMWILSLFLFAAGSASASAATVTIKPVFSASGAAFASVPDNRFAVVTTPGDTSRVTLLVINELDYIEANNGIWYSGEYEGIAASAPGSTLETGVAAFGLSAAPALPDGYASSGIVGVIPRNGAWTSVSTTTVDTTLANASGTVEATNITFDIKLSNPTLTGSIGYTVDDSNRIRLSPFTLSDGSTSYKFSNGWLDLTDNDTYSGLITTSDATGFNSIDYVMTLSGLPDANSDGNPDITDGTLWYAPYTIGENGSVTSDWFGKFWLVGYNFIYHHQLHWLYCTTAGDWLFAYSYDGLAWIGMSPMTYPFVYVYGIPSLDGKSTDSGWTYISQEDTTKLRIYFYSGSRAGNWWNF